MQQTKLTIPKSIHDYLKGKEWMFGGKIARDVAGITEHKESVVERRLREMTEDKEDTPALLEKRLIANPNGKGLPVIQYRLKDRYKGIPRVLVPKEKENATLSIF